MDGRGCRRDDVMVERLWRSLKYEKIYLHPYETGGEDRRDIKRWRDEYNQKRGGAALMTPLLMKCMVAFHASRAGTSARKNEGSLTKTIPSSCCCQTVPLLGTGYTRGGLTPADQPDDKIRNTNDRFQLLPSSSSHIDPDRPGCSRSGGHNRHGLPFFCLSSGSLER